MDTITEFKTTIENYLSDFFKKYSFHSCSFPHNDENDFDAFYCSEDYVFHFYYSMRNGDVNCKIKLLKEEKWSYVKGLVLPDNLSLDQLFALVPGEFLSIEDKLLKISSDIIDHFEVIESKLK